MPNLSDQLFDQVVDLLKPAMKDLPSRDEWLTLALRGMSVIDRIDREGSPQQFTVRLVGALSHDELIRLLRKFASMLGEEQVQFVDKLCERIQQEQPRGIGVSDGSARSSAVRHDDELPHAQQPHRSERSGAPTFNIHITNSTVGGIGAGTDLTVAGVVIAPMDPAASFLATEPPKPTSKRMPATQSSEVRAAALASVYLSYGDEDVPFAQKLYEALEAAGVPIFFRHEHAVPGAKQHRSARRSIRDYEHIVLLCSARSLPTTSVISELDEMLSREFDDGASERIIPILLDDYAFKGWQPRHPDIRQAVLGRVPLDMKGTERDRAKFERAFRRLLGALGG
jgi:hypothetical protein